MKKRYCRECNRETWQNPLKAKANVEQEYRCVECGHPLRRGGNAKNFGHRFQGKIFYSGPGMMP